ncbi:S-layer homology domain-containing protein [Paenibacillus piri]|uniref:S-layer homology domain-containing protein n=1 Tax=Paenibacillus piri TaxID=2547395 RepID=A0A4R5KD37_9BACL|nr:S-layer homology domain-containing protein [Paenibacillus piri]TDF93191.1 S-layer homology domain-containing protein [Paenibacillus piri]
MKWMKMLADTSQHWAKAAISTAEAQGLVSGYSDTTFGPDDYITREQMAVIMVHAAKMDIASEGANYTDRAEISDWAKAAIATATSKGLLDGYPDGTLKPQGNTSRAEAVTVIQRALTLKK